MRSMHDALKEKWLQRPLEMTDSPATVNGLEVCSALMIRHNSMHGTLAVSFRKPSKDFRNIPTFIGSKLRCLST